MLTCPLGRAWRGLERAGGTLKREGVGGAKRKGTAAHSARAEVTGISLPPNVLNDWPVRQLEVAEAQ